MRRWRVALGSAVIPLVVATAMVVPVGVAENADNVTDQELREEAACDAQVTRGRQLQANSDKVEKVVANGRPATKYTTRYVYREDGIGERAAKLGPYTLVHSGGVHASATAYSPYWGNYIYFADVSILHWISDPCSGQDDYAYAGHVSCGYGTNLANTPCYFDAWFGLEVSPDPGLGPWSALWGYSHRKNASPRPGCYAQGGKHPLTDGAGSIRTFLYLDGSFTAPSPDHPFNARKMTSDEMITGTAAAHYTEHGPCWPQWCDATTPPNNAAYTVFTSCRT